MTKESLKMITQINTVEIGEIIIKISVIVSSEARISLNKLVYFSKIGITNKYSE